LWSLKYFVFLIFEIIFLVLIHLLNPFLFILLCLLLSLQQINLDLIQLFLCISHFFFSFLSLYEFLLSSLLIFIHFILQLLLYNFRLFKKLYLHSFDIYFCRFFNCFLWLFNFLIFSLLVNNLFYILLDWSLFSDKRNAIFFDSYFRFRILIILYLFVLIYLCWDRLFLLF